MLAKFLFFLFFLFLLFYLFIFYFLFYFGRILVPTSLPYAPEHIL
jgi:hypothetical protein